MCQAIPRKVLQVAEGRTEVWYNGAPQWVAIQEIPDLQIGEYVIVYAGQALQRVPAEEAEELLRFLEELDNMFEEALE